VKQNYIPKYLYSLALKNEKIAMTLWAYYCHSWGGG